MKFATQTCSAYWESCAQREEFFHVVLPLAGVAVLVLMGAFYLAIGLYNRSRVTLTTYDNEHGGTTKVWTHKRTGEQDFRAYDGDGRFVAYGSGDGRRS